MTVEEVVQKWESFKLPNIDLWARRDGVKLIITPSGCGIRVDGEGKLIRVTKDDYVIGRDEWRAFQFVVRTKRLQTKLLEQHMRVPKEAVIGKKKTLQTAATQAKYCKIMTCEDDNGNVALIKPNEVFVTYTNEAGHVIRRRLIK
jgi:hypothetical protein